jgi:TolA-binding protein
MSHPSSESVRARQGRSSRPTRGPTEPPRRSRIRVFGSALLVTVACGAAATVPYFALHHDFLGHLIGRTQAQISYENQIADLRAQIDRMSQLNQERAEEIKSLQQRQVALENVTSGLTKTLSIQAENRLPETGSVDSAAVQSPLETTSAITHVESAKQAEQVIISDDKKVIRPHRKQARVVQKRTQEAPTAAADHNASVPAVQQNY